MGIITNLYIIIDTYQFKDDFIKLIRKIKFIHIVILDYDKFTTYIHNLTNNDLLLFFIENEDQLSSLIAILNLSFTYNTLFIHSTVTNFYITNTTNIKLLPICHSGVEILHHIEPHIKQFQKSSLINTTVDIYIEEVLENIGTSRNLSGFKYLKFILHYALKHYYLDKDLYQLAFNACVSHFDISESNLEKALRDLISYAYTNNFEYSYLFFLHYNLLHHKPTNTKYIEAAMDYTIQHFKDAMNTKEKC